MIQTLESQARKNLAALPLDTDGRTESSRVLQIPEVRESAVFPTGEKPRYDPTSIKRGKSEQSLTEDNYL